MIIVLNHSLAAAWNVVGGEARVRSCLDQFGLPAHLWEVVLIYS